MSQPKMNPKHIRAQKDNKIPFEYLVYSVLADDAHVHKHGGDKYGIRNWTIDEILASTYEGAMQRHLFAWCEGEDLDPDSGKPHLTHLRACCAVVMDADKHDKLIDDRNRAETKDPDLRMPNDQGAVELSVPGLQFDVLSVPSETATYFGSTTYVVNFTEADPVGFTTVQTYTYGPFTTFKAAQDYAQSNVHGYTGKLATIHSVRTP